MGRGVIGFTRKGDASFPAMDVYGALGILWRAHGRKKALQSLKRERKTIQDREGRQWWSRPELLGRPHFAGLNELHAAGSRICGMFPWAQKDARAGSFMMAGHNC